MKPKYQRLSYIMLALAVSALALFFLLKAMDSYIVYFHSPSDIVAHAPTPDTFIRLGGMVSEGSVTRNELLATFTLTDYAHTVKVRYNGILPALFREGQGIVAEGHYDGAQFIATTILAKHDEYYMPPDVAKTLKNDTWKKNTANTLDSPELLSGQ